MAEMTKMAAAEIAAEHATESHAPYLKVFAALAILTAIEYYYAAILKDHFAILVLGLLFLAVIKAGLVGWYFMHLKFEGNWVYIMLVPAMILAAIIVMALTPDMVLKPVPEENPGEDSESAYVVPAGGRRGSLVTSWPPLPRSAGARPGFEPHQALTRTCRMAVKST